MRLSIVLFIASTTLPAQEATFYRDVLPVLQSRCQGCHRPGEAAPMSFLTYSSTRPWAKAIRQAVLARRMPPWFAEAPAGHFANDPSLSKMEVDTLVRWADSGAPEGRAADAPPPLQFLSGWNIGKPDAVFEMPEPFSVPASGAVNYQYVVVPTNFREDRWIQAVEVRPGNRAVVHHIIAFVRPTGSRWLQDATPGVPVETESGVLRQLSIDDRPEFLLSYTPGRPPTRLPEGQARLIKAGSDIIFQIHYTTNGKPEQDRSKVGLIFAARAPKERVATLPISNPSFVIPPGAPDHRVDASATVAAPARLLRLIPHMHLRGKAFEVRLLDTSAGSNTLLRVPKYDFRWQNAYQLSHAIDLKPGMKIDCAAWFDNSANNPDNPDPKAAVRWGEQTWEEMMLNYVDVAVPADAEPKKVLARPSPAATAPIRDKFVGVYSLISYERRFSDGRVLYPYGKNATGRITYDKAGRMSAQLMNPDRPSPLPLRDPTRVRQLENVTAEEMRGMLSGFIAYYGLFDVDEANHTVIHHVKSCVFPSWVGTDVKRQYEFSGNRLTLTVKYEDSVGVLVWERERD